MITSLKDLELDKKYTYADYLTWQLKERVELIRGRIFKMSPAPNLRHQKIAGALFYEIFDFLKNNPCQVFHAPFDVRLPMPGNKRTGGKIDTVVQPDIVIVCDESILDEQGCNGAPDIVIEILSPGNTKKEMKDKFELYQHAGIPEYWLIDPEHAFILIYSLNEQGQYIGSSPFTDESTLSSAVLKGFRLPLKKLFGE